MWILAPSFVAAGVFGFFLAGKFSDSERRPTEEAGWIADCKLALSLGAGIVFFILGLVMSLTLFRDLMS